MQLATCSRREARRRRGGTGDGRRRRNRSTKQKEGAALTEALRPRAYGGEIDALSPAAGWGRWRDRCSSRHLVVSLSPRICICERDLTITPSHPSQAGPKRRISMFFFLPAVSYACQLRGVRGDFFILNIFLLSFSRCSQSRMSLCLFIKCM